MYQLLKYGLVGVINSIVGYSIIITCQLLLNFSPVLSNLVGYVFGILISFTLNSRFTFQSQRNSGIVLFRYILVFAFSYLCNLVTLVVSIEIYSVPSLLAQIPSLLVFFLVSFLLNKYLVFRVG